MADERIPGQPADDVDRFLGAAFSVLAEGEKVALTNARRGRDRRTGKDWQSWKPHRWVPGRVQRPLGLHFNCAAFRAESPNAAASSATRSMVVMLDDVGDMPGKSRLDLATVLALPGEAQPHAVIATRRYANLVNCQACWFIHPASVAAAQTLIRAITRRVGGDPGAISTVQWARLPGSLKLDGNGFPAELIVANLDAPRIAIGRLAAAFGVADFMTDVEQAQALRARSQAIHDGEPKPPAALVRGAMAALVNDVERLDWVRIGLALKWAVGPSPAISDSEAESLFRIFSEGHESFNARDTTRGWATFRPSGGVTFATIAWMARRCGWREFDFWQHHFAERERLEAQMDMEELFVAMEATAAPDAEPSPTTEGSK